MAESNHNEAFPHSLQGHDLREIESALIKLGSAMTGLRGRTGEKAVEFNADTLVDDHIMPHVTAYLGDEAKNYPGCRDRLVAALSRYQQIGRSV